MNRGEFEDLKVRFGDEVASWPAPFRQEASAFLAAHGEDALGDDERLDRLVLEAARMPTDERALARQVMARLAKPRGRTFGPTMVARSWSIPATAASMAVVVALFAAGGYLAAGTETDMSDEALLAFAVGAPPSELSGASIFTQEEGGRP